MYVRRVGTSVRCSAPSPISAAQWPVRYVIVATVCGGSRKQRQAPAPPVGTRAQSHRRTSAGAARALTDDRRLSAPYPRRKLRCSPFPRALSVCPVLSALSASRPAMMEMDELETPMERQQRSARARLFVVMEGGVQSGDTKVFDRGRHTHTHRLAS
jgi:hypothetical protein